MAVPHSDRIHPVTCAQWLLEALTHQSQTLTRYGQALHAVPQIRSLDSNKKDRLQDLLFDSVTHTDRDLRTAAVMIDMILADLAPKPDIYATPAVQTFLTGLDAIAEAYVAAGYPGTKARYQAAQLAPFPQTQPTTLQDDSVEDWTSFAKERFKLSDSAAEIVGQLMVGRTMSEIAALRNQSIETIKTQVKGARRRVSRQLKAPVSSTGYLVAALLRARMNDIQAFHTRMNTSR